jgi:hypothetical protein
MTIRDDRSADPCGPARVEVFNPPFSPQDPAASTFRWSPIGGAAAAVDALSASAEAHGDRGDMTRLSETETWLALAREDLDAAVAGVDAEQLAAMGDESVMTGPAECCGYPGADPEAGS